MIISQEQLVGKPKEIGKYNGKKVMENATKGGLHFIFAVESTGKTETLGAGSHPAIARFVAESEHPELVITSLEKSESLPRWICEREAPQARETTNRMRALEK